MNINQNYLTDFLVGLLNTPSPTGNTEKAIAYTEAALQTLGLETWRTRKGALLATLPGVSQTEPRAVTAHVDTLGAMVKEIKPNGRLTLSQIGGYAWNAIEGEGVTIATEGQGMIRGSVQLNKASTHVHGGAVNETKREAGTLEVRIDARTVSAAETKALGIAVGDFVYLDPRVEVGNGFIRSRHLDDKACVACVLAAVKALRESGQTPAQTTTLHISNYEEVGHGAAGGFPEEITELLTVDMAAIGDGQASDEFHCTLCVKDSGGPYHIGFNRKLRKLAAANDVDLKTDIYPYYGSDGEALWRAGADVRVALIGPGVDASHSYERTHIDALVDTARLIGYYLLAE
ncbi:MAG: M42 family metallopeptidase [Janthinobacterium lividum]